MLMLSLLAITDSALLWILVIKQRHRGGVVKEGVVIKHSHSLPLGESSKPLYKQKTNVRSWEVSSKWLC